MTVYKFDFNKTYRTRCGQHVKNVREVGNRFLRGYRLCDGADYVWHADGTVIPAAQTFDDLMPGAIEDEKGAPERTIVDRVEALERQMPAALGLTPVDRPATSIEQALQQLDSENNTLRKRVEELMHKVGKLEVAAVCDPIIKARESYAAACTAGADRAKQHPKVRGWLNVYDFYTAWHPTRSDADLCESPNRRACIKVPDFTDGEGL